MQVKKVQNSYFKYIFLAGFLVLLYTLTSSTAPPLVTGLNANEAVGPYLNGIFPDRAPSNPYSLEPAFPKITFNSPLTWAMHPNENKVFIGQRDGKIYLIDNDKNASEKHPFLDLSNVVGLVWDGGFLGMTFHPEFGRGQNYLYVYYCTRDAEGGHLPTAYDGFGGQGCGNEANWGNYLILERYTTDQTGSRVIGLSRKTLLKLRMYGASHRGGGLLFGDDGFLYLSTGDQTAWAKAQDYENNLDGGVLRIDVDKDPSKSHKATRQMPEDHGFSDEITGKEYWIPNDNPFLSSDGSNFEEYYSVGHRAPHRMTKDPESGIIYIGEVGLGGHEEVNILEKGKNYGWPIYEGNTARAFCGTPMLNNMPHQGPLLAFPRSEANSLIGGYVYRGSKVPGLVGKYICADYGAGNEVFAVETDDGAYEAILTSKPQNPISFGQDHDGEVYIMGQGEEVIIHTFAPQGISAEVPATLSKVGAFIDLQTLAPAPGVIPYEMIDAFWSDGANKKRWLIIPNDGSHDSAEEQINFSEDGEWELPVGAVLIKHFDIPIDDTDPSKTRKLETRFTVVAADKSVYGLTYKWRPDGSDADLLETSLDEEITIKTSLGTRTQTWHYPSRSECLSCHNQDVNGILGLKTRYLNRDFTYPSSGITANQLVTLSNLGILDESINQTDQLEQFKTIKAHDDLSASLETRARSFIDLNCSYCHRPGNSNRAMFDARFTTPLEDQGLVNGMLNDNLGKAGAALIRPHDVENSIIHTRLNSRVPSVMMPPLASNVIDREGVKLIEDWINSIPIPDDLVLVGSSRQEGDDCVVLTTTDGGFQSGAAWYPIQVDLKKNVEILFDIELGSTLDGADGAAFMMQQVGTLAQGEGGSGLGATGIRPSLAIEFDTYNYNNTIGDINADHMSIWQHGDFTNILSDAVCLTRDCRSATDGLAHNVRILWNAQDEVLQVYFDGALLHILKKDLVYEVFDGNSKVTIGLTGGTGGLTYRQAFCNLRVNSSSPDIGSPSPKTDRMALEAMALKADLNSNYNYGIGKQAIRIFPNPGRDYVFIKGLKENTRVQILSLDGRLIRQEQLNSSTKGLNINSLKKGMYLISVQEGAGYSIHKFVKQ